MRQSLFAAALLLGLAACSSEPDTAPVEPTVVANDGAPAAPSPQESPSNTGAQAPVPKSSTLALEGLGALRIGEPVPSGSGWGERGAQISDSCRTVSSPDFPGVYAIVEGGKVRRVSVGEGSSVKLAEGIGTGASEAEVRAAYGSLHEEPHKYSEAPAKYLTAPNGESGDPALRFEIGPDGKVALIHVGTKPVLYYVESCA